ncbi:MAG: hypothetical protein JXB88_16910 [Spirochaetales bacterium]|nr:hypothetical protein [Spirochaetales bacterium]
MKRIVLMLFLLITSVSFLYSLGQKEKQKPDNTESDNKMGSIYFGLVEVNNVKDVLLIAGQNDEEKTVYTLSGNRAKDIGKKAGLYLCIRGQISEAGNTLLVTEILVVQDSPQPDWNKARQIEIEGKIELGMNNSVCIITNWESKSRVSHYVYGPKKDMIKKSIGRVIKVSGIEDTSLEDISPFVKEIIVERIISLSGD